MANKSEEIIEKPVVSRGRPKKTTRTTTKKTKKATASKKSTKKATKKTTKKATKPVVKIDNTVNELLEFVGTSNVSLSGPELAEIVESPISETGNIKTSIVEVENIEEKNTDMGNNELEVEENTETKVDQKQETVKPRRSIKCPSVKKVSPISDETTAIKTVAKRRIPSVKRGIILTPNIENAAEIIVAPKNNKRTLKLNLNSVKHEDEENKVKDISESINQNSAFFNSPSIFDKFNIDITTTEEPEEIQNLPENEIVENKVNKNIDTTLVEEPVAENITENLVEEISEITEKSQENQENTNIEAVEETISVETENAETVQLEDKESTEATEEIQNNELESEIPVEDLISETDLVELIELNSSPENDIPENESEEENINEVVEETEQELKQVADNIVQEPVSEKAHTDNPIGKFFDSSIPSMTSTVNNTFSKIKKSFLKSPIFKKFTFEEASLATNKQLENDFIEPENNLSDIQKALENFTPNTESNITEMKVQAEPVGIITPVINVTTDVTPTEFGGFENAEPATSIDYTNVITISSDTSYDDIADDDYEPENYKFSNKLVDRLADSEENESQEISKEIDYDNISQEDIDNLKQENYDDETFSIESYFGIDGQEPEQNVKNEKKSKKNNQDTAVSSEEATSVQNESEEFIDKFLKTNTIDEESNENKTVTENTTEEIIENNLETSTTENLETTNNYEKILQEKDTEISSLSKLLEKYSETISSLSSRIENLENGSATKAEEKELTVNDIELDDIDLNDVTLEDLELNENDILDNDSLDATNSELVENLLSEALLNRNLNSDIKDELLSELLASVDNEELEGTSNRNTVSDEFASVDDFSKIIESLTKAITDLEGTPDIQKESKPATPPSNIDDLPNELISTVTEEKAINILINKDDIFSISIQNETYEIVTDFAGVSVLSENLHISTPKNNFYVKVGNKYIEIHKKKDYFVLNTNFEDIEFANAINNISFAKKDNKIELNIKEAFKLSSVNNKIELSILNKAIADITNTTNAEEKNDDSSICDNKTLLISEETQKVYLPYTIEEVMQKLRKSDEYQTVQEVIDNEYTLPLSTFKMPIVSRFKEAYRFMRVKEKSSVYAAVDLALELMFNSNLNPAVIRASKDLKELNIYLDCLYENEVEKFDCFKIIYKVLPKIK